MRIPSNEETNEETNHALTPGPVPGMSPEAWAGANPVPARAGCTDEGGAGYELSGVSAPSFHRVVPRRPPDRQQRSVSPRQRPIRGPIPTPAIRQGDEWLVEP